MISRIAALAYELAPYNVKLSNELFSIVSGMRAKWKKHSPQQRMQRKKWLKTPAGRKYQQRQKRIEKKPSTRLKRQRSRNRGIHHKYTWLH